MKSLPKTQEERVNSFQGRNPSSFALWKVLVCVKLGPVGNNGRLPLASYSGHETFSEKEEVMKGF